VHCNDLFIRGVGLSKLTDSLRGFPIESVVGDSMDSDQKTDSRMFNLAVTLIERKWMSSFLCSFVRATS